MDFSGGWRKRGRFEDEVEEDFVDERPAGCGLKLARVIVFGVVPLLALLAIVPLLLSSEAGRAMVLGRVNRAIAPAELRCSNWSLGWFGPIRLEQVVYSDPDSGIDLDAPEVKFNSGLLRLLPVGRLTLGEVRLSKPLVRYDMGVAEAARERAAAEARRRRAAGEVRGDERKKGGFWLPVADGNLTVVCEEGQFELRGGKGLSPFLMQPLGGKVEISSVYKPIELALRCGVGSGEMELDGRLQSLRDLLSERASGAPEQLSLRGRSVGMAGFAPLLEQLTGAPWLQGGVVDGEIVAVVNRSEQIRLESTLSVDSLVVVPPGGTPSPKAAIKLQSNAVWQRGTLNITKFELESPWLESTAQGQLMQEPGSKVLSGKVKAVCDADLAAVCRDFGTLLKLSQNFKMSQGYLSGTVEVDASSSVVRLKSDLKSSGLVMSVEGEPLLLRPEPALECELLIPAEELLEVVSLKFKAPFGELYGKGRFDSAVLKGSFNLTRFSRDFRRIFTNLPLMVGSVHFDGSTRQQGKGVEGSVLLKLSDVAVELRGGQRSVVPQGSLKFKGVVPLKQGGGVEQELQDGSFELKLADGSVAGSWQRLVAGSSGGQPVVRGLVVAGDADLGEVVHLVGGFLPLGAQRRLRQCEGRAVANATLEMGGGVIKARLNAAGQRLYLPHDASARWRVPDVRFESGLEQQSAKSGLKLEAVASGSAALEQGKRVLFAEPQAKAEIKANFASDYDSVKLEQLVVESSLLKLKGGGSVSELGARMLTTLSGKLRLDSGALAALVAGGQALPFEIKGEAERDFSFKAPLAGGVVTMLSEGEGRGAAHIAKMQGLGLVARPADATLKLGGGRLELGYEPKLNGGQLRLRPGVSLERGVVTVAQPGKVRVLEGVELTQEMADNLLAGMNPLFQGSVVESGRVSADVTNFKAVAGKALDQGVSSEMEVVLSDLKLKLGEPMMELLSLLKVDNRGYSVKQLLLRVSVRDQRIHLAPVELVFDGQPVTVGGWVGFNGQVKYVIEVPLTDRLIGGAGAKLLSGRRVKIPVAGTVDAPKLDTGALRDMVGKAIKDAAGERAAKRVGEFLDKLKEELGK